MLFLRTLNPQPNQLPPNTSLSNAVLPYDIRIEVLTAQNLKKDDFALKFQNIFDTQNAMLRAIIIF